MAIAPLTFVLGAGLAFGCQQDVVLVGSGGAGGLGGEVGNTGPSTTFVSHVSSGNALDACGEPAPVGSFSSAIATAAAESAATGSVSFQCTRTVADSLGHQWQSSCNNEGCTCTYDGAVPPVAACGACSFGSFTDCTTVTCCPAPWSASG